MKVAILTSQSRYERFVDKMDIPTGVECVFISQNYTNDDVVSKAGDSEVILVDAVLPVNAELIQAMPNLKMIHSEGVGFNKIDTDTAAQAGIYVCNNRAVNSGQVAEQAILLILTILRRFSEGEAMVRAGKQAEAKTRFIEDGLGDLVGAKVGLIGFGAIGKELSKRLRPFGCEVYYYSSSRKDDETEKQYGVKYMEKDKLLKTCDIISLHVPVTPATEGMIDKNTLQMMKPSSILINTARGAIVRTADVAEAIRENTIYGFGADTLDPEPVAADDPILMLPEPFSYRVSVSPHIGGTTKSAFAASYKNFWKNVARLMSGVRPENIVNNI